MGNLKGGMRPKILKDGKFKENMVAVFLVMVADNTICILSDSSLGKVEVIGVPIMLAKPNEGFEFWGDSGLPNLVEVCGMISLRDFSNMTISTSTGEKTISSDIPNEFIRVSSGVRNNGVSKSLDDILRDFKWEILEVSRSIFQTSKSLVS